MNAFFTRYPKKNAIDNCAKVCSKNSGMYFSCALHWYKLELSAYMPKLPATKIYTKVATIETIITSNNLLVMNWALLQPSIIFWRCVLKVYSLVTSMITNIDGNKIKKDEKYATECHVSGNENGFPKSNLAILLVISLPVVAFR